MKPIRAIKGVRPLFFRGDTLYCARYNRILATQDLGATFTELGALDVGGRFKPVADMSALARRVLRMAVYRLRIADNGNIVCIFKGGLYLIAPGETRGRCVLPITRGSRPVSLAARPGGLIVFGEYFSNPERGPIDIVGSDDCGATWKTVYRFPAGAIRHVHGLAYDAFDDCFWIATGDYGDEARLLRADPQFQNVETVLCGGQINRFYSIVATADAVFVANDSPNADNYIRRFDKRSGETRNLARIENSSFYSCMVGDTYVCSTNAEPPEPSVERTWSAPNDFSASYVWMSPAAGEARRAMRFPADVWHKIGRAPFLPPGLFQYPRVFFPEGDNPSGKLVCYATGLKGVDDHMLVYDAERLGTGS